MKRFAIFIFIVLILSLSGCKNNPTTPTTTTTSTTTTPIPPKPGDWTTTTAFGSFDFTVDAASTSITQIKLNFSNWHGISGSVIVSQSPPWSITNRSFKSEFSIAGNQQWTIEGTFEQSGDKASGTWKVIISGQTESGTWQALPKS
jgi:hypothetical protein